MLPTFHLQTSRDGDKHADHAEDLAALDALAFILEAIRAGCSIRADDCIGALDFINPHPDGNCSPEWTHARLDLAPVADGALLAECRRQREEIARLRAALASLVNDVEDIFRQRDDARAEITLREQAAERAAILLIVRHYDSSGDTDANRAEFRDLMDDELARLRAEQEAR